MAFALVLIGACGGPAFSTQVVVLKTPDAGIQPQAAVDSRGIVHLIYFKGDAAAGDIYYATLKPGAAGYTTPIRVNSQPGSAIAVGTIRGAQIAVGTGDTVHVAWNGSGKAMPKGPAGSAMLYTRLAAGETTFEPQRNLMTWTGGLDGGGSLAADRSGHVYVTWHGSAPDNKLRESGRAVFVTVSNDNGKSFTREKQANPNSTGACGCCAMRDFVSADGSLYIVYRSAAGGIDRDTTLLVSHDHGATFTQRVLQPWNINACPMSSASIAQDGASILGAWETRGQVYCGELAGPGPFKTIQAAPGAGERKHPVVVSNVRGETLLAWTEGTGWQRGGTLAWQVYDAAGRRLGKSGRADGVPVWGLLTAFARPDGTFVVLH